MTEKVKEKAKPKLVVKSLFQHAKLEGLIYEHKVITSILQNIEKMLRYAEILDPKLNKVELIKQLVSRKVALKKAINIMLYSIFDIM